MGKLLDSMYKVYAIMKLFVILTYFKLNNYIIPSDGLTLQKNLSENNPYWNLGILKYKYSFFFSVNNNETKNIFYDNSFTRHVKLFLTFKRPRKKIIGRGTFDIFLYCIVAVFFKAWGWGSPIIFACILINIYLVAALVTVNHLTYNTFHSESKNSSIEAALNVRYYKSSQKTHKDNLTGNCNILLPLRFFSFHTFRISGYQRIKKKYTGSILRSMTCCSVARIFDWSPSKYKHPVMWIKDQYFTVNRFNEHKPHTHNHALPTNQ
ncbi:hypothetical protein QTP88_014759 [Uroleucon formosanum]